jgi:hypothetical protein
MSKPKLRELVVGHRHRKHIINVDPSIKDVLRAQVWALLAWAISPEAYFRELACVHGTTRPDLNSWAIETAFDRDDDLVFDMQELMQGSS